MISRKEVTLRLNQNCCKWFEGRICHPEPDEIDRMVRNLQEVLLPNYFRAGGKTQLTDLDELHQRMAVQVHRAKYKKCMDKESTNDTRSYAYDMADQIISRLPDLQEMLYEDVLETYNSDPAATGYDEVILTYPGLFALTVYRIAHVMYQLEVPLLPRMMTEYAHRLTGIDLHPGASIGRGIMIDHGTGIVIGETAVVGNHVKIYQGVTLGALYFPRDESGMMLRQTKRHPTVEDDVVLYSHASVLGGDTVIGHHSVIGSNAWVISSLPPYTKVKYQAESLMQTQSF